MDEPSICVEDPFEAAETRLFLGAFVGEADRRSLSETFPAPGTSSDRNGVLSLLEGEQDVLRRNDFLGEAALRPRRMSTRVFLADGLNMLSEKKVRTSDTCCAWDTELRTHHDRETGTVVAHDA